MKHDHRQSLWLIAGGAICWCYQCGAWKLNRAGEPRAWNKPSGIGGANPAMRDITPRLAPRRPEDDEAFEAMDQDAP